MRGILGGAGLCLLLASPAAAQGARETVLRLDNDILALRGREAPPDYDYTHGLSLSIELPRAPRWLARSLLSCHAVPSGETCLRTRLGGGQRIYTPRHDAPEPLPGERPYAAWLYVSGDAVVESPSRRRTLTVELGVTGRPALGEPVQNGIHRLLGSERQEGWDHQLGFQPGILLRYEDAHLLRRGLRGIGLLRLVPAWRVTAGNVRRGVDAGIAARLGRGGGRGVFGSVAARQEWVLRDLFLDGNTLTANSLAERLPLVTHGEVGVGYAFGGWALEYVFTARSREYQAQPGPHRYGSLILTLRR
ncbi:MAG TPA: lipid A deacylase LpxR family protein [Longimicrobium sp.]|nr:lipid A deacylase LpxR family protein [Longimicrobium sp.]